MFEVHGGIYLDAEFTVLEEGTEERYGPFTTYKDAYDVWNAQSRWKIDICGHRLFIKEIED